MFSACLNSCVNLAAEFIWNPQVPPQQGQHRRRPAGFMDIKNRNIHRPLGGCTNPPWISRYRGPCRYNLQVQSAACSLQLVLGSWRTWGWRGRSMRTLRTHMHIYMRAHHHHGARMYQRKCKAGCRTQARLPWSWQHCSCSCNCIHCN